MAKTVLNMLFLIMLISLTCIDSTFLKAKVKSLEKCNPQPNEKVNPMLNALVQDANGNIYIELKKTGARDNYSMYKVPRRKPWGQGDNDVITVFTKLRFDPNTLKVHTGDFTYSTSQGYVGHHNGSNPRQMPYGTAWGCESPNNADASARIDLTGTPFAVDDQWVTSGYMAAGRANLSANNQIVDIVGGGYCGWHIPKDAQNAGAEGEGAKGGWHLKLKVIG
jgi:hypothetical protein